MTCYSEESLRTMSSPLNPLPPGNVQPPDELPSGVFTGQPAAAPVDEGKENPPWTLLDVVLLTMVFAGFVIILLAMTPVVVGTIHLFGYDINQLTPNSDALDRFSHDPRVFIPMQCVAYLLLLSMMVALVRMREPVPRGFFEIIGWRWPRRTWLRFVLAGIVLAIVIQMASQWLPIPPSLPIEKFFQTRMYAYLMAGFGILIAPAIEELYFRGFLYPVLARAVGMVAGVAMTSLAFTLLHGLQLSFSWAAMLMIFIVGLALTLVRAWTRSVAAGVLLHMSYNATLFVFAFIASDGFRHLEKV